MRSARATPQSPRANCSRRLSLRSPPQIVHSAGAPTSTYAPKSAEWSNPKHRQQWENTLKTYVFPHLENVSVSAVDLPHVLAV